MSRGGLPTPLPHSCSSPDSDSSPPSSDGSSPSRAAVASSAPPPSVSNLGGLCERPPPQRRFIEVRRPTSNGRARRRERGEGKRAFARCPSRQLVLFKNQGTLEVTLGPLQDPNTKFPMLYILYIKKSPKKDPSVTEYEGLWPA